MLQLLKCLAEFCRYKFVMTIRTYDTIRLCYTVQLHGEPIEVL